MIAGVGGGNGRIFSGGRPVKAAGVHKDAPKGGAVPAQELRGGVDHKVRAVFDGADQIGGAEGVVHHQRETVPVGQLRKGVQVRNVAVGVAQGLHINPAGVFLDGRLHLRQVVDIDKTGGDPEAWQSVGQQIIAAAVDGFLHHKMSAVLSKGFQGIGDGGGPGSQGQGGGPALQSGDPALQHVLGGVGQAAVDVSGIRKAKARGGVFTVPEYIGGGGVNGDRPGVGGGIRGLLPHMEL